MGTVTQIRPSASRTTNDAVSTFIRDYVSHKSPKTQESYGTALNAFVASFGEVPVHQLDPDAISEWFTARWGEGSASGWNVARSALRKMAQWWDEQHWGIPDPFPRIAHRKVPEDRTRALTRQQIRELLDNPKVPLREKLLWSMLYETAARANEILGLNVEDLDTANLRAKVTRKGSAHDYVTWQTKTARLIPRYLQGRATGPLFVTSRAAKDNLGRYAADKDDQGRGRLSYRRAEDEFRKWAPAGTTLHQLRHSRLTHDAEDGDSTPELMSKSGHTSVRSLVRYARVGVEAQSRRERERDPNRRK